MLTEIIEIVMDRSQAQTLAILVDEAMNEPGITLDKIADLAGIQMQLIGQAVVIHEEGVSYEKESDRDQVQNAEPATPPDK